MLKPKTDISRADVAPPRLVTGNAIGDVILGGAAALLIPIPIGGILYRIYPFVDTYYGDNVRSIVSAAMVLLSVASPFFLNVWVDSRYSDVARGAGIGCRLFANLLFGAIVLMPVWMTFIPR